MTSDREKAIRDALKNPEHALKELERLRCERSLFEFVKTAWPCLHPGEDMVAGWTMETICRHLEAVTDGSITRLLVNVPPGFAKSLLVNVFWPAWEWGPKRKAHHKFISASYEKGLAIRDLMLCRDLLKSEWFQSHWPLQFKEDQDGKSEYSNTGRGWRYATSVGAGLTGRRGHRFVIDDPHSVRTAESTAERDNARFWFAETTPTRFINQKRPVYVVIMQRLHESDISGLIINKLAKEQGWTHLCIPMQAEVKHTSWTTVPVPNQVPTKMRRIKEDGEPLPYYVPDDQNGIPMYCQDPRTQEGELAWPERFDTTTVEDLKAQFRSQGGSYAEAAQLQQRPVPRGGGMFERDNFQFVDQIPEVVRWVRGWDLAATDSNTAAHTVGVKMGLCKDGRIVIADVDRFRKGPAEVESRILRAAHRDGRACVISIPQDPGQAGKAQIRALGVLLHGFNVRFSLESGDKENRAIPLAAQVECGNVVLLRAPWNDAFLAEAGLFPSSDFKDQIDACSRAYTQLLQRAPQIALAVNKIIQY